MEGVVLSLRDGLELMQAIAGRTLISVGLVPLLCVTRVKRIFRARRSTRAIGSRLKSIGKRIAHWRRSLASGPASLEGGDAPGRFFT